MPDVPPTVPALYTMVAEEYLERLGDELDHKPFDRERLTAFARRVRGPVADLGCGPGHVTRFLADAGLDGVFGLDLAEGMVELARRLHPDLVFRLGDVAELTDHQDASWGGAVSLYSIVHFRSSELRAVFQEWARVVRPGGELLLGCHLGGEVFHTTEWWGHDVDVHFVFHDATDLCAQLEAAGWRVDACEEREPYAEAVEYGSRRVYLQATRQSRASGCAVL